MFDVLARIVTRWPKAILFLTLGVVLGGIVYGFGVADRLNTGGYVAADAESVLAEEVLDEKFPFGRPNVVLLVRSDNGVDDPAVAREGRRLAEQLADEPHVQGVTSYWQTNAPTLRSEDSRSGLIVAQIRGEDRTAEKRLKAIAPRYRGEHGAVEVLIGGPVAVRDEIQATAKSDIARAELIGIPIIAFVLMIVFRSFVASFLPLIVGIVGVIGTNAVLRALSDVTDVSIFSLNLATGLSLGLAVDYALFIVRRHREELQRGADVATAIRITLHTAGRTVAFSSLIVIVSMSAMLLFPMYFLRSFAYAGMSVVLLASLAALIPLSAALVLLGRHVNSLNLAVLAQRALGRRPAPAILEDGDRRWRRLAGFVTRRPVGIAVLTTALLLALGGPVLGINFGIPDDRSLPSNFESHIVQQELRDNYEARPTAALDVVADGVDPRTATAGLDDYAARLSRLDDVVRVEGITGIYVDGARVQPPNPASGRFAAADATYLTVTTSAEEISTEGKELVRSIRDLPAPFPVKVGGASAELLDTEDAMKDRFPWAIGLIAGTSFLLIFLLSGSLLVPFKAVVMNTLSLAATFGALVWVFQGGHFSDVLNFQVTGSVAVQLLVLLFCVAFGVSMDYEVFLLSRIREAYDRTRDNTAAIVFGIERTGGVVTAAAVITSIVFLAMGTAQTSHIKMFGLGLAFAVLLDATIVRALLVPAVMRLAGGANWWLPRPLRWVYDRFGLKESDDVRVLLDRQQIPESPPSPVGAVR